MRTVDPHRVHPSLRKDRFELVGEFAVTVENEMRLAAEKAVVDDIVIVRR